MDISSVALGGLQSADTKFDRVATRIGQAGATDTVDLSPEAVNLLSAKEDYTVNLKVLQVADDMTKQTLNILA